MQSWKKRQRLESVRWFLVHEAHYFSKLSLVLYDATKQSQWCTDPLINHSNPYSHLLISLHLDFFYTWHLHKAVKVLFFL